MTKLIGILLVILGGISIGALVIFGSSLIFALPVKWLWNYLMPELFKLQEIGFWQAFCLLLLTGLLFRTTVNKSNSK